MSQSPEPQDDAWDSTTYGDRAGIYISARHLHADHIRVLEPRIDEYVGMNLGMRKAFVEQVTRSMLLLLPRP